MVAVSTLFNTNKTPFLYKVEKVRLDTFSHVELKFDGDADVLRSTSRGLGSL